MAKVKRKHKLLDLRLPCEQCGISIPVLEACPYCQLDEDIAEIKRRYSQLQEILSRPFQMPKLSPPFDLTEINNLILALTFRITN